jgi:hypothetical protein
VGLSEAIRSFFMRKTAPDKKRKRKKEIPVAAFSKWSD